MNFTFLSMPSYEYWDWNNPTSKGIGGSETSHVEMVARLAARGHSVHSYAPVDFTGQREGPGGAIWEQCKTVDGGRFGVWVIYREPTVIADIPPESGPVWIICQDVDYSNWTAEAFKRVTRIVALCQEHALLLKLRHPEAAHKVCISSNGIRPEFFEHEDRNPPERNPFRLMYASSPDRGLWYLIEVFERAKELMPELELHTYYGFENIKKVAESNPHSNLAHQIERMEKKMAAAGVINHGRIGQRELIHEWFKAGIWCHPSVFPETSCITCMEAQAAGAIPITNPIWACRDNVQYGSFIEGNPQDDPLARARYVMELIKWAGTPGLQNSWRRPMMLWARNHFDWNNFVDQWEEWARDDLAEFENARLAAAQRIERDELAAAAVELHADLAMMEHEL